MATSNRIGIEIAAEVTGDKSIEALARELEDMAKLAEGDLAKAAKAAADRMRELGEQDAAVAAFMQLKAQAAEGAKALNAAAKEAEDFARQIAQAGPPTAQEAASLQKLQAAAKAAGDGFAGQQQALAGAQAVLQKYGIAADSAQTAQQRIRKEADEVREAVATMAPAYEKAGQAAVQSAQEQRAALEAKNAAIKTALQVEQSEIEVQRQQLAAAKATQQARLQAAQAQGNEAEAMRAGNALRQVEADQLALTAREKRAQAEALQASAQARREELAAVGPLTEAQNAELKVTENQAKALHVAADAAGESAQRTRELASASKAGSQATEQMADSSQELAKALHAKLEVERSEIELQRKHLDYARAEEQARLKTAQAQNNEAAATRAGNALRQIEADQMALVARAKRAEADAVQEGVNARRAELAALGPLSQAHAQELRAAENHAQALRVESAAAQQAAARARDLTTAHKSNAKATDDLAASTRALRQMLGQLASVMGVSFSFRELVTAAAQMEQLRLGLTAVTQDASQAAKELDFVRQVAGRIGADVTEVGKAFLGLSAATRGTAVEGEPTRAVFEAVATAMGKAGKSSAETANALMALSQMASKGVVQSEELRGQLGEALPGALNAAAKGLGITTAELLKLVEAGQITAQDIFPALVKGLNEVYGASQQVQTLTQEFTNVKNAAAQAAERIGDAGWLDRLKTGAEGAQTAITLLGEGYAAATTKTKVGWEKLLALDFSGFRKSMEEISASSQAHVLKAAEHNEMLRKVLSLVGIEAGKTVQPQQQAAQAAAAAGNAAATAADDWIKLNNGYRLVLDSLRENIAQAEKSAAARDAEGKASIALAQAFGGEKEKRDATAQAAEANALAQEELARLRQQELAVMRQQLVSLKEEATAHGKLSEERAKQIAELERQIGLRQADADKAKTQAQASRLVAELSKAEAQAHADNSGRVNELRDAYERARVKMDELRAAKIAGKSTQEEVTRAEIEAGKAALLYRDAVRDQVKVIEGKHQVQRLGLDLQAAEIQKQIEQQRGILEVARARKDEYAVARSQSELRKLEIELLKLSAQAQRADADAALASAEAKKAELIATNEYVGAKKLEIEAAIKAAEVKRKLADVSDAQAKALRELASVQDNLRHTTQSSTDATKRSVDAHQSAATATEAHSDALDKLMMRYKLSADYSERQIALLEREAAAVEKAAEAYRKKWNVDKDGFTLDSNGQRMQQGMPNERYVYDTAKGQGLDEATALRLAGRFWGDGKPTGMQRAGMFGASKDWFTQVNEAINAEVLAAARQRQQAEYEASRKPAARPEQSAPASPATTASRPASSGVSNGITHVLNINLDGQRFGVNTDAAGADNLLRVLERGKLNSGR